MHPELDEEVHQSILSTLMGDKQDMAVTLLYTNLSWLIVSQYVNNVKVKKSSNWLGIVFIQTTTTPTRDLFCIMQTCRLERAR